MGIFVILIVVKSLSAFGLLFLPAGASVENGKLRTGGTWVSYWSAVAVTSGVQQDYAWKVTFGPINAMIGQGMQRHFRFAIRLASRSELFGCSVDGVVLLFLPAASQAYWSPVCASPGIGFGVVNFGRQDSFPAGLWWRVGSLRFSIRLASRSELFGCSVDGVGLLFLPAAGMRSASKISSVQNLALQWSGSAATSSSAGLRAYRITHGVMVQIPLAEVRVHQYAIRLASREDCLDVMSVVFGLLFLPAPKSSSHYYSITSFNGSLLHCWAWMLKDATCEATGWAGRSGCRCIRLASREDCLL